MSDPMADLGVREERKRRRIWPWVVGILGVLLAVLAGLSLAGLALASEAMEVRDDLELAQSQLATVPDLVSAGDAATFDTRAAEVLEATTRADDTVQGPLWEFATWIPGVGQNVAAVRSTTEATHILVRDALPPSFAVLSALKPETLRFEGGGFNLEPFRQILAELPGIDAAFASAQAKIATIDRDSLLPIVDEAVGQVIEVIDQTAPVTRTATEVLPTALKMLGEDEPRTYLVLFQNNAEIRATGGIPAASVFIRVDSGRIELIGMAGSTQYQNLFGYRQHLDLPAETLALYDPEFAINTQNYTRTPHFPTIARLFNAITVQMGYNLDGVLSLDPVALSHMLAVTGPVNVDGVEINSDNVVRELLSETYLRNPGDQAPADAFFEATSAAVFAKLTTGGWDLKKMLAAIEVINSEQRLYGWFSREEEQAVARELGMDGELAQDNTEQTQVGIFLNDAGVSKMEYYLTSSVAVTCDTAARTLTTSVTMTNSADRDDLTFHILSRRTPRYGGTGTSMLLDVLYFAPPGARILSVDPATGDAPNLSRASTEEGRSGQSISVLVDRGQTRTVTYVAQLPEGDLGPLAVRYAPTVTDTAVTIAPECAALTGDGQL